MQYKRIQKLREAQTLTQRQMAELLHVSPSAYSRYERGVVKIPLKVICGLADYHHTSVDYLMEVSDQRILYGKGK